MQHFFDICHDDHWGQSKSFTGREAIIP